MISGLPNFTPFAFATAMPCACLFLSSVFAIVPVSQDSSCLDGQYLGYRASRNEIVCCFTTKKAHPFGYALNSTCARRFELPTFWSVARRSIQLSYAHITVFRFSCVPHSKIYYSVGPPGCQQVFSTFSNFFHWNFSTLFSL